MVPQQKCILPINHAAPIYQQLQKQFLFLLSIEEYLDTNNTCFIPDKCLTALNCDIQTVQKHISFNTKAIRQTKHYDDETESWVGERGYWLDKRN